MDLQLADKVAVVLASSSGLGLGVATSLAREGARVLIVSRDHDRIAKAAASINESYPGKAIFMAADLGASSTPEKVIGKAQELGGPDILVNNSGGPAPSSASAVSSETWAAEFSKMALPIFEMTRLALPTMRAKKWGRILTIASSGVVQPIGNLPVSNGLRSSIVAWMKTLAGEVARDGITVNVVLPGRIDTDRVRQIDGGASKATGKSIEEITRAAIEQIPAGRYGSIEEFANVVAFLASAQASYVTGSIIRVDGGMIRAV